MAQKLIQNQQLIYTKYDNDAEESIKYYDSDQNTQNNEEFQEQVDKLLDWIYDEEVKNEQENDQNIDQQLLNLNENSQDYINNDNYYDYVSDYTDNNNEINKRSIDFIVQNPGLLIDSDGRFFFIHFLILCHKVFFTVL